MIRQSLIVLDLQTNSQLFLQGLLSLKTRLYAMASPTTNDIDSYLKCDCVIVYCMYVHVL